MKIKTLIKKLEKLEKENGNLDILIDDYHYFVNTSVHNCIKSVTLKKSKLRKNYILIKGA